MKLTLSEIRRIIREEISQARVITIPYNEFRKVVEDLRLSRNDMIGHSKQALETLERYLQVSDEEDTGRRYPGGKFGKSVFKQRS